MNTPAPVLLLIFYFFNTEAGVRFLVKTPGRQWIVNTKGLHEKATIFAKRSPSQSKSISIGLDVDGITFAISPPTPPPPGKVPIAYRKQHPGEYNIRPVSDYIWTAP